MKLIPFEDRVTIIQDDAKAQLESGLFIPETSQRKPSQGTVDTVGPGKPGQGTPIGYFLNDEFLPSLNGRTISAQDRVVPVYTTPIKEGDRVLFSQHAGVKFTLNEQEYIVMRPSDIIARI